MRRSDQTRGCGAQIEKDSAPPITTTTGGGAGSEAGTTSHATTGAGAETGKSIGDSGKQPKTLVLRFHDGSAKIASSVAQHLAGLLDAKVTIPVEIEAEIPTGAPDNVVRTVTENCRTLKFENSGFEES